MQPLGTWLDFMRVVNTNQYITVLNTQRDLGFETGRGMGTADAPVKGFRYWPGTTLDAPVGGRIWYPAFGSRNATNGQSNAIGTGVLPLDVITGERDTGT